MLRKHLFAILFATLSVFMLTDREARSEASYPSRPITLIVPFGEGPGATLFRLVALGMSERLGQKVTVELRPGDGGTIGTRAIINAPPDGYTIGFGATPSLILPFKKVPPYDFRKDVGYVSFVLAFLPPVIVAPEGRFPGGLKQLIEEARANPEKMNWGAGLQTLSQVFGTVLLSSTGGKAQYVPSQSEQQTMVEVLAKRLDFAVVLATTATTQPDDKVQKLAIAREFRSANPRFANIPALNKDDTGYANVALTSLRQRGGIIAPVGTPQPVIKKLEKAISDTIDDPRIAARMHDLGADPDHGDAAEMLNFYTEQRRQWREILCSHDLCE